MSIGLLANLSNSLFKSCGRVGDMGSLVISPVVSDIGQHANHPIMVTADSQPQHVAPDRHALRNNTSFPPRHSSITPARPPPPSQRGEDRTTRDAIPHSAFSPSTEEAPAMAHHIDPTRSPAQAARAHPSLQWNQHSRGFDQSGFPLSSAPRGLASSPNSPRLLPTIRSSRSLGGSEATSPSRIKIRDLSHIQSFASEELVSRSRFSHRTTSGIFESARQYEISAMPVTDIIEMVAGLLTKITTTNDRQYDHLHRPISHNEDGPPLTAQTTSVLAFHGKNVPTITILSYLSRIHKYCPTTYEVFLSLLVYFDRMTEVVNRSFIQSMQREVARTLNNPMSPSPPQSTSPLRSPSTESSAVEHFPNRPASMTGSSSLPSGHDELSRFFVVDSYNIHRLVIAAVTCASKFFSDVFYTNSRYAKVGGLPLAELNHLELQFLLLNDFRLSIPVEELEAYGTMLVEFYAREVLAQQQHAQQMHAQQLAAATSPGGAGGDGAADGTEGGEGSAGDIYMRDASATPAANERESEEESS